MSEIARLAEGLSYTLRQEGVLCAVKKIGVVVNEQREALVRGFRRLGDDKTNNTFYDVIFINGCDYNVPHPIRYRIDHQREQLEAAGVSSGLVEAKDLTREIARHGRTFVFFRCPLTPSVEDFIEFAKHLNKRILFDIDDLVIDTRYTNQIPYVAAMSASDKIGYDDGVMRTGKTLRLCDAAITTTGALADELRNYVPRVYVNRNTASELMVRYSEIAIWRRDVLPNLELSSVRRSQRKQYRLSQQRARQRAEGVVRIGYFSGSITHNADFELILPTIVRVLHNFPKTRLVIVGELDLPQELVPLKGRISATPFCEWKRLPGLIADCDINVAPLADSLFNRAKSENKWVEASLVKVATVASNVGAFADMIQDGITGLLCTGEDEWYEAISSLIQKSDLRRRIGREAYSYCLENCTTVHACNTIAQIIRKEQVPNLAMVFPSLKTSGGVLVALQHCCMLQDAGVDVTLVNTDDSYEWKKANGHAFPVLNRIVPGGKIDKCPFMGTFDKAVATLWDTLDFVRRYQNIHKKYYLVQNYESEFYNSGEILKIYANATYACPSDIQMITISKWCCSWLETQFTKFSRYARNGLDCGDFYAVPRDWSRGKIRILIEGDCESPYKNVDESFYIANKLPPDKYEIWYMSYTGKKKPFYRIDKNLGYVPHGQVADVYRKCHILLKTSRLESFSYPPLEMMATGGCVVAAPNGGNAEYLLNGTNCLLYDPGDYEAACRAIELIVEDDELRNRLRTGGLQTARSRDWSLLGREILRLYE